MTPNLAGILAMMAAQLCFVINDATMKWVAQGLPLSQSVFLRGLLATSVLAALVAMNGQLHHVATLTRGRGALRTALEIVASLAYLYAVMAMPIADLIGMFQLVPLAITAGAALLLGEKVGWRRWTATLAGFAGALIIVRPGAVPMSVGVLLGLVSIVAVVGRDLITRGLPSGIPVLAISLTSALGVTSASLIGLAFEDWRMPDVTALALLAFAAAFLVAANSWQIFSLRTGEISVVGPFRYSVLIWAIVAGYWLWGELPDRWSWAGMAILTLAGIYTFAREQTLKAIRVSEKP